MSISSIVPTIQQIIYGDSPIPQISNHPILDILGLIILIGIGIITLIVMIKKTKKMKNGVKINVSRKR